MNNDVIKKHIKSIIIGNFIHSAIHILLDIIHIIVFYKTYFITEFEYTIFFAEIFIICFFTIIPIIINVFLYCFKHSKKFLEMLKNLLKFFFYLFFINGLIISINAWNNAKIISAFYYDCPFNFKINDLSKIFENYQINKNKEINNKCNYKRCFPIDSNNDKTNNNYICNIKENIHLVNCSDFILNNQNINMELIRYVEYCKEYTKIYECERKYDFLLYKISYDFKCPNKSDISFNYAFAYIFIFIDSLLFSVPWLIGHFSIKDLILLLYRDINRNPSLINYITY